MKRINFYLFVTMAMWMLSVNSAWADSAFVKVTAEDGTVSWIPITGTINGTNIDIYKGYWDSAIDENTQGSIDLNEVWYRSGGRGTHYQVTSIGGSAFCSCSGLTSVVIPNSLTSIGDYAFAWCSGLTSVVIPNSLTSIGQNAFSGCSGLTSIVIPSSVRSIGRGAFRGCSGLTTIVVESSNPVYDSRNNCNAIIETASKTLIAGCNNTKIPFGVTSIAEGVFNYCSGLTSIDIPSSVMNIGTDAFNGCSGLTSVVIPFGVTNIATGAFSHCSGLTSIVIPSSVTSIGSYAFAYCNGLTSITSYITDVFKTGYNAFSDCENATLYVPYGLVRIYRSTADWNRLKIEEIPDIALAMSCNNKGIVLLNGTTEFTNDMGDVNVYDGVDNTFVFIPEENCQLEQVLIDGLDVTLSVKNNQLTKKVYEGSKMIVTFSKSSGDMNGDGMVNISDVVALVNLILGQ